MFLTGLYGVTGQFICCRLYAFYSPYIPEYFSFRYLT